MFEDVNSINLENNNNDTFFYGIDKNNHQIMLISLLSLLEKSNEIGKNIEVSVLARGDELYDLLCSDFSIIQKTFPNHKLKIKDIQHGDVSHIPINKHNRPVSSYLRLLIPELSEDYNNKSIYLDADTIIHQYPHDVDLKNNPVGAYEEGDIYLRRFRSLYTNTADGYFNSGVLYFNNKQYLLENINDKVCDFLQNNKTNLPDQDALNYAVKDIGIHKLSQSYNTLPRQYKKKLLNEIFVFHYAGKKPREKSHNIPFVYVDLLVNYQDKLSNILNTTSNNKKFSYEIDLYGQTKIILKEILGEHYYRLMRLKEITSGIGNNK